MKSYILRITLFAFLIKVPFVSIFAQQCTLPAGAELSGNSGSVSYSVGQLICTVNNGANGFVAHGVQQPYEISVVTDIYTEPGQDFELSILPNPFTDALILRIDVNLNATCSANLYDFNGRLIVNYEIFQKETIFDFSSLVPAIYFLRISMSGNFVKTFKIIKN